MKTVIYTAIAIALAAPVAASTYDLGDAPLSPAQFATVKAIMDSDDNENKKQRRIDVVVGNTATFNSAATADAAELMFFLSADESSNDIERRIKAAIN